MKLTDEERSKLDPPLLRLLEKQPINESDYDIHIRPDGTKVYGVIIRGTNPEHVSQLGIQLNSVFGNVIFAHTFNGQPLPAEHGGPMRVFTPRRYAWKGAKWINGLEFLEKDKPGFWEVNGYSNTADPWKEERFW